MAKDGVEDGLGDRTDGVEESQKESMIVGEILRMMTSRCKHKLNKLV